MRVNTVFTKGKPNFARLGQAYRVAREGGKLHGCKIMGRAATLSSKHVSRRQGSSFGLTQRSSQRMRRALVGENALQQLRELPANQRGAKAHQALLPTSDLTSLCSSLRGLQRMEDRSRKEQDRLKSNAYVAWQEVNKQKLSELQETIPCLQGKDLHLLPYVETVAHVGSSLDVEAAVSAVAWSQQHKVHNLGTALEQSWDQLHLPQKPMAFEAVPADSQQTTCQEAGRCIYHCEPGRALLKLRNALLRAMKAVISEEANTKVALNEGYVVLQLSQVHDVVQTASSSSTSSFQAQEYWMHIAMQYWKPFRSTFHAVNPVAALDWDLGAGNAVHVKACQK